MLASALLLFAQVASLPGCGKDSVSPEVESLVMKAQDAGGNIDSYHMTISMFFDGLGNGSVKTEEVSIDISGSDISLQDTYFDPETGEGTVIQEVVHAGDRQWSRDLSGGEWAEVEATLSEEVVTSYTAHISDYLSESVSAQALGSEEVNGVQATRLRFELSLVNVSSLLPDIPQSSLEDCTGGQVDIWLDAAAYYPVKYEMVFRNVDLGSGYDNVDVRINIDITGINQPLEITPPV